MQNGAGGKIRNIEIPQRRTRTPSEILTETELSIFKSGIDKLTWIARMERPDLMYDVFEAAKVFQEKEIIKEDLKNLVSKKRKVRGNCRRKRRRFSPHARIFKFPTGRKERSE